MSEIMLLWGQTTVPGLEKALEELVQKSSERSWEASLVVAILIALALAMLAVARVVWVSVKYAGAKGYSLGERYVGSTEKLHESLKESIGQQQVLCDAHRESIVAVEGAVDEHDDRMKRVVVATCTMCQKIAEKQFPEIATDVTEHCSEIKRIIGEA